MSSKLVYHKPRPRKRAVSAETILNETETAVQNAESAPEGRDLAADKEFVAGVREATKVTAVGNQVNSFRELGRIHRAYVPQQ